MAIVKFEIDTLTTPMDAVAEVLRILSGGTPAKAPEKAPEKVEAPVTESPKAESTANPDGYFEGMKSSDVLALANKKKAVAGMPAIKALLTKYDTPSITGMDPANYKAFIADLNAL